ncbi:hypothetical protein QW131_08300 [Roseibium salinum]|nr:hypothetical protein [Roseibium salinum]
MKFQRKEIEQHTAQIEAAEAQIAANADRRVLLEERVAALSSLEKEGVHLEGPVERGPACPERTHRRRR